jgi:HNH endonuclease
VHVLPRRSVRGPAAMRYPDRTATIAERLSAELVRKPNGCLEWTGNTDDRGYGRASINGKPAKTHHLAWTLANGPIPPGLCVLHHCDNPPCAQTEPTEGYPDGHLFLGTKADNNADKIAKGRDHNQRKTHCSQGHEFTEANTYTWGGHRKCRACGRVINLAAYHKRRAS